MDDPRHQLQRPKVLPGSNRRRVAGVRPCGLRSARVRQRLLRRQLRHLPRVRTLRQRHLHPPDQPQHHHEQQRPERMRHLPRHLPGVPRLLHRHRLRLPGRMPSLLDLRRRGHLLLRPRRLLLLHDFVPVSMIEVPNPAPPLTEGSLVSDDGSEIMDVRAAATRLRTV